MNRDVQELLRRQAQWQRSRKNLPWPEKIRMAEQVRDSIGTLRATAREDDAEGIAPSPPDS